MGNHPLRGKLRAMMLLMFFGQLAADQRTFAQGCMPSRFLTLESGAALDQNLDAGEWEASLTYRYLKTARGYIGDEVWANSDAIVARTTVHSFDIAATYAITPRYSVSLTIPFTHAERSSVLDMDGTRHTTRAGGLGDIRLVAHAWLLDPQEERNGNVSVGVGIKAPTGDEKATDTFYKPSGPEIRPVDQAIQPGDGGWGIQLELAGYQRIFERLYGYVSGAYLVNPREQNSAYTTGPYPAGPNGAVRQLSAPDQYSGRAGVSYEVWPAKGFSVSVGGRIDGVPTRDLIGGSDGFRRPGYAISVEPGVSWRRGDNSFSLFTPVLIAANRQKNIYDDRYGTHGPAAFADFVVIASFAHRF